MKPINFQHHFDEFHATHSTRHPVALAENSSAVRYLLYLQKNCAKRYAIYPAQRVVTTNIRLLSKLAAEREVQGEWSAEPQCTG